MSKLCIVTGVGPGTGKSIVKKFASKGYQVAMIARDKDRLTEIAKEIPNTHGFVCDVADEANFKATLARIKEKLGAADVAIHNAVGGAFGDFLSISPDTLRDNFDINAMALLHLGQAIAPDMIEKGAGAIIATGNTSAYRGVANFSGFAPTKAAQRILLESMARFLGPKNVHAAYVAIDAVIDVPWARQLHHDKPNEFFAQPDDIAGEVYHIAHQPKTTWSHEITIRPAGENW